MAGFDIAAGRPKMTGMGDHLLPVLGGLAAGAASAALAPAQALENAGPWVERWVLAPFAQLVYLGLSCF